MAVSPFALPAGLPADPTLLATLLNLLPMGVMYYTPVVDATGTLTDLTLTYLNPTAQRITQLPAQPGTTYRQQFPTTDANGAWDFHRRSWLGQEPGQFQFYYDADGFDSYFRITAQRLGEGLLTIFTDTRDEARSPAEQALLDRQARERAARAEAEQQASTVRAEMRQFFDQAPVGISLVRGPQLVVELVNEEAAVLLGSTQAHLLGKPLLEVLPRLREQALEPLFARVLQGETFVFEELPVTVDRAHLNQPDQGYYRVIYQPWRRGAAEVIGMLTIAVEVTDQVVARQQVQALNEDLRARNEEYYHANTTLGEVQQQLRHLNQELETRVQVRTQEAQAARRLAEMQRQRLEQLFLQAPAAICILDGPDFVYELVNPAYQQLFPGRALQGRPLLAALPELTDQPVWHTLQQVYRTGQTHLELGIRIPVARTADGPLEDFYFNYIQQARFNEQGKVDGIIVFAFDVTGQILARQQVQDLNQELLATNEELQESNRQLTRTNVDLDTFVYTASHDLKAPITNIESIVLALRETLPAAGQQNELTTHLLDLLDETTARFQRTIGQLTDLSKLQLAHAGPAEPVNLAAVVESVRLDLAPLMLAAKGQLTVAVAPDLVVSFSPANLRSVVYNLLSNALKYRAPDRPAQVWLRATRTESLVTVQVQDNGLGLNEHQQQRLFGLFQRLHTHVEGTGVGLYITKRLVENGGGTIAVESQVNVGTTFTLTLPA